MTPLGVKLLVGTPQRHPPPRRHRPLPASAAAPCSRRRTLNLASTRCRWPRTPRRSSGRSAPMPVSTPTSARARGTAARSASRTRSSRRPEEGGRRLLLRRRERPRPVPDPAEPARIESRQRPARPDRPDRRRCRLYELYDVRSAAAGSGRPARARSGPHVERAAPRRLDLGGRGRPADPARARALRRGRRRRDPHALRFTVRATRRAYVYPARHVASDLTDPNLPPMGLRLRLKCRLPDRRLPAAGADRARGAEALRDDRRRQRIELVHHRRARSALVERRPAHARRVKGTDFQVVDPSAIHP